MTEILTELVNPNVRNFIKSLRDVGYTFEIAVADIIDNSITAEASEIKIFSAGIEEIIFCMLDNGHGMAENELIEAMRLAAKNPEEERNSRDLGRFGLGLKTASFSQCKKLTVLSRRDNQISIRQWDLDYIYNTNEWLLITPAPENFDNLPLIKDFYEQEHGTLIIWQNIDRYNPETFSNNIDRLRKHLSLVFHRFLEGSDSFSRLKISINNNPIKPFNPFNINHPSTQVISSEKLKFYNSFINIQPFILPHHSKVSQQEWENYATEEGYIKSQGFYLYRANRLLIYGTWWGLHRASDAHKLVRIKIDIANNQDAYWGIDIKKSKANPVPELKKDLKRIINEAARKGSKPYTGRGRTIKDKTVERFWEIIAVNDDFRFALNKEHPVYKSVLSHISEEGAELLEIYLKGLEAYMPLEAIQAQLQQNPHKVKQESALSADDVMFLINKMKTSGLDNEYIERLLKTEIFKNFKELLANE